MSYLISHPPHDSPMNPHLQCISTLVEYSSNLIQIFFLGAQARLPCHQSNILGISDQSYSFLLGMCWIFSQFLWPLSLQDALSLPTSTKVISSRDWGSVGSSSMFLQLLMTSFWSNLRPSILSGKAFQVQETMRSRRRRAKNSQSSGIDTSRLHSHSSSLSRCLGASGCCRLNIQLGYLEPQ